MRTRSLPTAAAGALVAAVTLGGCDALSQWFSPTRFPVTETPLPGPSGTKPTTSPIPTPSPTAPPQFLRIDVLAALRQSPYLPLFTTRLINDGIGIFAGTSSGSTTGARRWGRDYKVPAVQPDVADVADVLIAQSGGTQKALVVLKRPIDGIWIGDFPWRKSLVKKGIAEEFQREALFERGADGWKLAGMSVATQKTASASVGITKVEIRNGTLTTIYRKGDLVEDRILRLEHLAAGLPGEQVSLSVTAFGAAEAFVSTGGNRRQQLSRDGTSTTFTGTATFPDVGGIGQIGIDVVATRTLEVVAAEYDATIWGIPVVRKGGAL